MPSSRRFAALAILLIVNGAALGAQSLTFGEIGGTVIDAALRPVGDAEVRVRDRSSGATRWLTTSRTGEYRFAMLPGGRYDLTVEALGYEPVTHLDITVAAGYTARVTTTLHEASLPVTSIDTVRVASVAVQPGNWLLERGYADLMGARRTLGDLSLLNTTSDEHGVEGLPWRLTGAMVDGARSLSLASPRGLGSDGAALALPLRGASFAEVGGLGFDVEVGGTGVGARMATQRAGRTNSASALLEGGTAAIGGAFIAGGPLQGDTAQAIIGLDYQRSQPSRPALLGEDPAFASALVQAAQGTHGTDLAAYATPQERVTERLGAFGRLDWQPADRFAVSVRASGSRLTSSGLPENQSFLPAYGDDYDAVAAQASINVFGRVSRRISHEMRVSVDVASVDGAAGALPMTRFAASGLAVGGAGAFDEARTVPRVSALLHFDFGAHRLKTGASFATHLSDSHFIPGALGEYRFGDVSDFDAASGAWRRVEDGMPAGEFRQTETAFFLQDAWHVADGFSITLGGRVDVMGLPRAEIESAAEWLALTGVDNRDIEKSRVELSPRLGFHWELGRRREWLIEGGAGVFQEVAPRRDVAEALALDGGADVRLGVGALGTWPTAPSVAAAPVAGRTLTILGPEFQGPRTRRLAASLTRRFGSWSSTVGGVYRHTDFLTRRRDLNLVAAPLRADQAGRPLYGELTQVGSLLAASPGSNRRFTGFDAVHALESTGFSDYWGLTVGVERLRDAGLSFAGSYTFSRTTDNVLGLAAPRLSPFPDGIGGLDWSEGRSDLDVPHRLLLATEWSAGPAGGMRIGAVYLLSSGLPFTPGLRGGVDANGDGDGLNDPAFVDPAMPGMSAIMQEWSCVGTGGLVERNACRGDLRHRLDLRASFRVAQLAIGRLDLVLDALDVLASAAGRPDHALLLVDRTGGITIDGTTGVASVPYVVNPRFGSLLEDRSTGILWRAGLRIVP